MPTAGTYTFKGLANDAIKLDYLTLTDAQAYSSNLDYKGLNYSNTTGPIRVANSAGDDGSNSYTTSPPSNTDPKYQYGTTLFSVTVSQPSYVALRMYWVNWGNDNDFILGWSTPSNSSFVTVPPSNTCDPLKPAAACFPDISISKTGPAYTVPSSASSNTYLSYTLNATVTASATGNAATYGTTTVTDTLPAALSWVSGTSSYAAPTGWTCSVAGQVVTCTTSNVLSAGSSYPITLNNLLVATGTAAGQSIVNNAAVSNPYEPSSLTGNNTAQATTKTVLSSLVKSVSKAAAYPGDTLHYCITASNNGGADLNNYQIKDYVPAQLNNIQNITFSNAGSSVTGSSYDTAQTTSTAGTAANGLLTSPAITLASGTQANLCFDATIQ